MRTATGEDEHRETHKHPVKLQVFPLADEIEERDGNGVVGQRDERVRSHMQPHHSRPPEIAMAMRHEAIGREQVFKKVYHSDLSLTGKTPTKGNTSNDC